MNPGKTRARPAIAAIAAIAARRIAGGLAIAALSAAAAPAGAQSRPDSSAWGDFPAATDSTTAAMETREEPTWEQIVDVPYEVIKFPFKIVGQGVGEVVGFSDRIGLSAAIGSVFSRRVLPPYTSVGIKAGGDDGFGASIAIAYPEMPGEGNTVRLKLDAATEGDHGGSLAASFGTLDDGELQMGVGYRVRAASRYFGTGPESRDEDRSIFLEESGYGGATYARRLGHPHVLGILSAFYSGISARGTPRDEDPELSEVFASELPPGYHDRSEGFTRSLELRHDDTDEATRPDQGGLRRAKISGFRSTDEEDVQFWTWRGELQQFVPLWFTKRALALRAVLTKIEAHGDDPVAFQRLMTNDEPDLFRGYADLRFRDLGLALATAEYRWPVWSLERTPNMGADLYAFADVGQVFSEVGNIGDDLTTSYGGGLRLGTFQDFIGRVEFGISEEGTEFRFGFEQTFQYDKLSLLRGRVPVPDR